MTDTFNPSAHAFKVSTGYANALSRKQMDASRFERPFHGVRTPAEAQPLAKRLHQLGEVERARTLATMFLPLMPQGGVFSHLTALLLVGCPIRTSNDLLHVSVPEGVTPPRRRGVLGHRHMSKHVPQSQTHVAPFSLAIAQSARLLDTSELIVAVDFLLCPRGKARSPLVAPNTLMRQLATLHVPGVVRARSIIEQTRQGAESRMETLLRLRLNALGFTQFALQVELHDAFGFIGRFDLVDRTRGLICEYDGEQHRTQRVQYVRDVERLDRVRALGWRVARFHAEDVFGSPARVLEKIERALASGIALP